jgi:hypothetical protein
MTGSKVVAQTASRTPDTLEVADTTDAAIGQSGKPRLRREGLHRRRSPL